MGRYRKKPVEVEAIQYTGDNLSAVTAFVGEGDFAPIHPDDQVDGDYDAELYVAANGAWVPIEPGEWILRDQRGCYPCKADIFAATYEPVDGTG